MTVLQEPAPDTTMEEFAALDFTPWSHEPDEWQPPSNHEWANLANPHLVSVRLAWLTLHKTGDELVNVAGQLGDEMSANLISQLGLSADWFKGLHEMLASAEARLVCACAAHTVADQSGRIQFGG